MIKGSKKKSEFKGLIMEDTGPEIKYILEPQIKIWIRP